MQGKTRVLITGAGSGIGRAMAIEAARRGHALILAGRQMDPLRETASLAESVEATCVVADVTSAEGRAAIRAAVGARLDILINNAGTLSVGHLSRQGDDEIEAMISTNLTAPILLTRDLLPALRAAKGRIVNMGSVFGDIAFPYFSAYSASKFGLRGFSDALRRELSGSGVHVTYIAPRATRTAAESAFGALIEPMGMTLDSADAVARHAWDAISRGKRDSYPRSKESFFVLVQRIFPGLIDRSVGAQARDNRTISAVNSLHAR